MHTRKTQRRRTSKTQRRILAFLEQNPGALASEIREALGLGGGALVYDSVRVLIERGLLKRWPRHKHVVVKRFYGYGLYTTGSPVSGSDQPGAKERKHSDRPADQLPSVTGSDAVLPTVG